MSVCDKCNVELSGAEVVLKCLDCKLQFYPVCTRIDVSKNITKNKLKSWKCDSCKGGSASVHSSEDTEDRRSTLEALNLMKQEINANIDSKMEGVQTSIKNFTEEIKELKVKINNVEADNDKLKVRCDMLERERDQLGGEVRNLRLRLADMEQYSRRANIEIQGIPLTTAEDINEVLKRTAKSLGVQYKKEDVSIAHRLRVYSNKLSAPPIIAQFVSRSVRDAWTTQRERRGTCSRRK